MVQERQSARRTVGDPADRHHDDGATLRVPAAQFKAHCLSLIEQVRLSRRPIVVTKHGRPVAKVVPFQTKPRPIFGFSKGTAKILGNLTAPTGERWDVDAD